MKSLPFFIVTLGVLSSLAAAEVTPISPFAMYCNAPMQVKQADGTEKTLPFQLYATPERNLSSGIIAFCSTNTNITGFGTVLISHPEDGSSPFDWIYSGEGISVKTDPATCDAKKHICTATIIVDDSITLGSSGPSHQTSVTAKCRANSVLTMPDAIKATLANNPNIQAAKKTLEAVRTQRGPLWERYIGQLSASLQQERTSTASNMPGASGLSQWSQDACERTNNKASSAPS